MSTAAPPEPELRAVPEDEPLVPENAAPAEEAPASRQLPVLLLAATAACSSTAAMFLVGGLFIGFFPRIAAVVAPVAGVALAAWGLKTGRSWLQLAAIPAGALLGALMVVPEANGQGSANLPELVVEAVRGGGLIQPPLPFDPGWRFILALIAATLGAGTLTAAAGFGRPRLAVVIPVPIAVLAELVQPKSSEVWSTAVVAVLIVAAIGFSYGAELQSEGVVKTGSFELRRLGRTGMLAAGVVAAILILSQTGFLFPQPERRDITPPQRPHAAPPQADRQLFTYRIEGDRKLPFRIGTIDIYDPKQHAWLLPPYDTARLKDVSSGKLPTGRTDAKDVPTYKVTVTIGDEQGHVLPEVAGTERIGGLAGAPIELDPRTGIVQLSDRRVAKGMTYTLTVLDPATGSELIKAAPPPKWINGVLSSTYLDAPEAPTAVQGLLQKAPTDPFDRMQYLRNVLLSKVVGSGAGVPVDVSVPRVVQMLNGGEASPYEITAAEALLARWAGVPSRIGYGYYDGAALKDGWHEIRPRNGATWLEAYFTGYGWVPIVGVPLQAKNSNDDNQKNRNFLIHPSDKLSLIIYVPTRETSPLAYFQVLAYYLELVAPWLILALLVFFGHPALVKVARYYARRRWARQRGPAGRVTVAYAEFRDMANDLTYGDPHATPLEYLRYVQPDVEHSDLAWLVTRVMWGDLRRDLTEEDAAYAEELGRSLLMRLVRAQNVMNLLSAAIARTSLREPFSEEIPRLWPKPRPRSLPPHRGESRRSRGGGLLSSLKLRQRLPKRLAVLFGILSIVACGADYNFTGPAKLPANLTPPALGALQLVRSPKLDKQYLKADPNKIVTTGEVWLVRHDDVIEGSVQISLLARDVRADDPAVLGGLDSGIGGQSFRQVRITDDQVVWIKQMIDQRVYLWFPPRSNAIELVVLRKQFSEHVALVRALIDFQHGRAPQPVVLTSPSTDGVPG